MEAGTRVGPYEVVAPLGAGGMGVVYRARDTRLGRDVALKFLPLDLARVPGAIERFTREATVISSLNHPHICTLHDIGTHEGRHFLVLELLEGQSLRHLLNGRPLSEERATSIAVHIADALGAAHAKGIVHRDVKPANILVTTREDAKLLDFGVAKLGVFADAVDRAQEVTREALTAEGALVGTPEYMAPEQVRGEPADARSDFFALGAVMFEMATGHAVFAGQSAGASVDAVLNRAPPRLAAINPRISADFERIVLKALEKDPALRYQNAKDLIVDLRRLGRDTPVTAAPSRGTPRDTRWPLVAGLVVVGLMAGTAWWITGDWPITPAATPSSPGTTDRARLVVLPFENLTRQPDDDWLAGALADSVGAGLQNLDTLILVPRERVVELYAAESRSQSAALGADLARRLSQRLRVRYYVHGSYQKIGETLRIVARLVDLEGDAIQAQDTLTGAFGDVLQLEDQLASRFAAQLVPGATLAVRADASQDLEAYRLATNARTFYALGRYAEAKPLLQEALERDPKYALAWAMLSKVDSRLLSPAVVTGRPRAEDIDEAMNAATTAVALSATLADSHVAMALAYRGRRDFARMQDAARKAIALDPKIGEPRILLGDALSISPGFGCSTQARPEEAEAAFRAALIIDPLVASGYVNLTTHLWWMNRPVDALASVDLGLAANPGHSLLTLTRPFNLVFANRVDEADAILTQRAPSDTSATSNDLLTRAFIALRRGQHADALQRLASPAAKRALESLAWNPITTVALFQAGQSKDAGSRLEQALKAEPTCQAWASMVPALEPFRANPEFTAALTRAARR